MSYPSRALLPWYVSQSPETESELEEEREVELEGVVVEEVVEEELVERGEPLLVMDALEELDAGGSIVPPVAWRFWPATISEAAKAVPNTITMIIAAVPTT